MWWMGSAAPIEPFSSRRTILMSWRDWPTDYVRLELEQMTMLYASRKPMGLTSLPAEALAVDDRHRLAWLMGRAVIDGLAPAGIY